MSTDLKMPARQPLDGPIEVRRMGDNHEEICIRVTNNDQARGVVMSEYNAWRVLGALSLLLGLPLSKAAQKAIKF